MDELFLLILGCGAVGAVIAIGAIVSRQRKPLNPAAPEDRERLQLRLDAQHDHTAATELRRRLTDDLKRHQAVRRHLQRDRSNDREGAMLMQAVDRAEQETLQQLAQIDAWLSHGG